MCNKTSYQLTSLFQIITKVSEKVLYEQLEAVASKIFPQNYLGFAKRYSLQNALVNLLKNWT